MITRVSGRLKTQELEDGICHLIIGSSMKEGDPIPSENRLCEQFGVSRITVRSALARLVEMKVLRTERGRGSFVAAPDRARAIYGKDVLHRLVAILVPTVTDNYFGGIVQSFESSMRKAGFNCVFSACKMEGWAERDYIEDLGLTQIDGIALAPWESAPLNETVERAIEKFRNVVLINEPVEEPGVNNVSSDDVDGAFQAVKYLLSLGHRRIAHIQGPELVLNAKARLKGYRDAMLTLGPLPKELVARADSYKEADGFSSMESLLALPEPPSAVFCANDNLAAGALRAAISKGVKVPEELSIIGYGNSLASIDSSPRISSVDQGGAQIGLHAAELMLDLIFGRTPVARAQRVAARLVFRDSCGPAPVRELSRRKDISSKRDQD